MEDQTFCFPDNTILTEFLKILFDGFPAYTRAFVSLAYIIFPVFSCLMLVEFVS